MAKRGKDHGLDRGRLKRPDRHYDIERAFAEEWEKENARSWGYGTGILQRLMFVAPRHEHTPESPWGRNERAAFWITARERVIVATVIQWLGTNCGFGFLTDVLRKAGYTLVRTEEAVMVRRRAEEAAAAERERERQIRASVELRGKRAGRWIRA